MAGQPDPLGAVRRVPLDRSGGRWAAMREPTGLDEQGVGGRTTQDAVRLLDRLLVDDPAAAVRPGEASTLTLPDRDLLLAAAWRMGWGATIAGTITCAGCGALFDFDFDIEALAEEVRSGREESPTGNGVFELATGVRFRLPSAQDEIAVIGLPLEEAARELLARCIVSGDATVDGPFVEEAMEQVGSGIDMNCDARCPECGCLAAVRFQVQDYLLAAISADWPGLVEDIHRMARAYHWSLQEILSLPRTRRRAFLALLDGDAIPRSLARQ